MRKLMTTLMAVSWGERIRTAWIACTALAAMPTLMIAPGAVAGEAASQSLRLDIPAQDLNDALQAFALASRHRLLYSSKLVDGKRSSRVSGELTTQEAVEKLLAGTGLKYEITEDGLVMIRDAESVGAPVSMGWERLTDPIRIAQTEAVTSGTTSSEAQANPAAEGKVGEARLEEIVVTAQKREERLQDVPIAISVLSGDNLDGSPVQGIADALKGIPGIAEVAASRGGNTPLFIVRGVTTEGSFGVGASTTGYYLDSVPFGLVRSALSPEASPYDLDRIEVLRGPQGTLYGVSALNGVVRILTKDANLRAFEFKGRASAASTADGDESYRGDMAINVPLVEGKLAARAAIGYQDLGGWIDRPSQEDANDGQIKTGRFKLNAQPTDALSIGLSAWFSRGDYGAPPISQDGRQTPTVVSERSATDSDIYSARLGYQFSGVSLTSATSYMEFATDWNFDLSSVDAPLITTDQGGEVLSQELNLTSTQTGSWRWTAGGIYRDSKEFWFQAFPELIFDDDEYRSESFAIFGELTRLFLEDRFGVTAGVRYFEDKVTDTFGVSDFNPGEFSKTSHFDAVSPRVVLTWHPSGQTTLYGSYGEGFRSGLNQLSSVTRTYPSIPPAEPDTLKNYEIGAKTSLWDGRANIETALFYMDWQDVQQSLGVPIANTATAAYVNAPSASGIGFEVAASVEPVNELKLSASFGWNDLTVDEEVLSEFAPGGVKFAKGQRLNFSPETTAAASADFTFPLASGGLRGRLSVSASYVSKLWRAPVVGDSMLLARAGIAVESANRWIATLFADNLFDNNDISLRDPDLDIWHTRVRPRTVGLQLEYRY